MIRKPYLQTSFTTTTATTTEFTNSEKRKTIYENINKEPKRKNRKIFS